MITIVYFFLFYAVLFVQSWRFRKQEEFVLKNKIRKQMIVIQFFFLFFIKYSQNLIEEIINPQLNK